MFSASLRGLLVLCLMLCCALTATAQQVEPRDKAESGAQAEAWLLTYGPGEIYWQRFGHNAIWIRDPARGLDHAFNFGFFDFQQERFFLRFLQGRLLYFSAAQPVRVEFAAYIDANRSIRAQKLDLEPTELERLTAFLLNEVRPENRHYLYDYYRNNCSTRVRDAIDLALGGALASRYRHLDAPQTWRDHTRRLTTKDFWISLGLQVSLGAPVDRRISLWDEMFIPHRLADLAATTEITRNGVYRPLVIEDALLFESTLDAPPATPPTTWPRYLLVALMALMAAGLLSRWIPSRAMARGWLTLAGLMGVALLYFWFGTDHAVARLNLNLLVLNPLWLALVMPSWKGRFPLYLVGGISVLAVLMPWLPPQQYTLDVLAAFLPLNLASAWVLSGPHRQKS